jgi:fermentation-respiration switch protein FrsA (DUF1100 family)
MRTDIQFTTGDGLTLRGWHVTPDATDGPVPTIVMAHGLSAVKEMGLLGYAEAFARAGMASVVFDHRCFADSEGEPRQEADPVLQVRDYRDAISFAETLEATAADRIGVWGTSFAGGHAIVVAACDRRVRCVVSQVPLLSGRENALRLMRAQELADAGPALLEDRRTRFAGGEPAYLPVVSASPDEGLMLPTRDAWEWFTTAGDQTSWENRLTLRTAELAFDYEPRRWIAQISPTPLLMIVAAGDILCQTDVATDAFAAAREPKRLELLPFGHFDLYHGPGFEQASALATAWFAEHLTR